MMNGVGVARGAAGSKVVRVWRVRGGLRRAPPTRAATLEHGYLVPR